MPGHHHRERRTTKVREYFFSKLGPLCEYTRLLKKTEWTEPIHLVHEMELIWCIKCNGKHWSVVALLEHDDEESDLLGWMQRTGYE